MSQSRWCGQTEKTVPDIRAADREAVATSMPVYITNNNNNNINNKLSFWNAQLTEDCHKGVCGN